MAVSNDSIAVTPGSGALVATHSPGDGKEYQVVMLADFNGQLVGSDYRYRLMVPSQTAAANKVFFDLYNDIGSGVGLRLLSILVLTDIDTAITGTLGVELNLFRTTSIGTGGTAATAEGSSTTAPTVCKLDTLYPSAPPQITARSAPTGGATSGAWIGTKWVFTEETSPGSHMAGLFGGNYIYGSPIVVREGSGIKIQQGAVASVGSIAFMVDFALV